MFREALAERCLEYVLAVPTGAACIVRALEATAAGCLPEASWEQASRARVPRQVVEGDSRPDFVLEWETSAGTVRVLLELKISAAATHSQADSEGGYRRMLDGAARSSLVFVVPSYRAAQYEYLVDGLSPEGQGSSVRLVSWAELCGKAARAVTAEDPAPALAGEVAALWAAIGEFAESVEHGSKPGPATTRCLTDDSVAKWFAEWWQRTSEFCAAALFGLPAASVDKLNPGLWVGRERKGNTGWIVEFAPQQGWTWPLWVCGPRGGWLQVGNCAHHPAALGLTAPAAVEALTQAHGKNPPAATADAKDAGVLLWSTLHEVLRAARAARKSGFRPSPSAHGICVEWEDGRVAVDFIQWDPQHGAGPFRVARMVNGQWQDWTLVPVSPEPLQLMHDVLAAVGLEVEVPLESRTPTDP